jgi:hypothetical protein
MAGGGAVGEGNMNTLAGHSVADLLQLHVQVGEELRSRGMVRSANNPVGDFAEYLFCRAFGWQQAGASESGFDARDEADLRYQIKSRRLTARNTSRQMSALRNMDKQPFDFLAAVLFGADFKIYRAALIPFRVVLERSKYGSHVNSHRFLLHDDVWSVAGVVDVTDRLRLAMP